ncbi:hypothetical protein Y032_0046g1351 [Ancylostoma ceylanicum]|uniref:Uncharacterized protein n=1 Tax=Ancylostoma ceylanicum TaxID=53326 RepID=A0A016UBH3_9BILA|nr:hypothetical protein Y032_0046g1351 [Ancylostoma ceylanicum]
MCTFCARFIVLRIKNVMGTCFTTGFTGRTIPSPLLSVIVVDRVAVALENRGCCLRKTDETSFCKPTPR